jgi:dolichyl-phosphate-mannose--protein O-mannosyl transferase
LVFDERYYVREACGYAFRAASACGETLHLAVHPPLAKWLIAGGIALFGHNPVGWRIVAAVAGTATVGVVYLLGRRLLGTTWAASLAAALLAADFLHFIHSRLAMLDVFLTLFATSAVLCCVYDVGDVRAAPAGGRALRIGPWPPRPWRALAGLLAGAAMASKGPGAFALAAAVVITLGATWDSQRAAGNPQALVRTIRDHGLSVAAWYVMVPLAVYVVAHAGTVTGSWLVPPWTDGAWLHEFAETQQVTLGFHAGLNHAHLYESRPWFWFSSRPPVLYYFGWIGESAYEMILGFGNPMAWWFAVPAITYVAASAARARRVASEDAVIVLGFLFAYAPWFVVANNRPTFLYYLLPALPFMYLALARAAMRLAGSSAGRAVIALWLLAIAGVTVLAYPLVSAGRIDRGSWRTTIGIARPRERPTCEQLTREPPRRAEPPSNC